MATGNDLNPCQLVDVEHRFLNKRVYGAKGNYVLRLTLQTRKLVRDDQGRTEWTEWQDVPVVES